MTHQLLVPLVLHIGWVVLLYALLTIARAPSVWGLGRRSDGSNPWAALEARISANLSNQFEWPMLFYAVCCMAVTLRAVDAVQVVLAWTFVSGRVLHSIIQIGQNNLRIRGVVFTVNFLAVLAMWAWLLISSQGQAL